VLAAAKDIWRTAEVLPETTGGLSELLMFWRTAGGLPEDCRRNLKYRRRRSHVSMIDCLSCARSSNDVLAAAKDIWRTAEGGLSELLRVE